MKIAFISDTHGSAEAWRKAAARVFDGCGLVVHAGDILYHGPRNPLPAGYDPSGLAELINHSPIPVVFARGNCDADIDGVLLKFPVQAPYTFLVIEGTRVLVTHGTDLDSKGRADLAAKYGVDLFVSGHTHVPVLEKIGATVFLNPGSSALPKNSEGATAAIWDRSLISVVSLVTGEVVKEISLK